MTRSIMHDRETAVSSLEASVWEMLATIHDPEIPAISLVDLGVIRAVRIEADEPRSAPAGSNAQHPTLNTRIVVELMPTFLGCPAIGMMREMIEARVGALGSVRVALVRDEAWTTERITEEGRRRLHGAGFAPPPRGDLLQITALPVAECPYCGSRATTLDSAFGPTACRAIHYCNACRQPFEQFKMV